MREHSAAEPQPRHLAGVFANNFGVRAGERVLIVTDDRPFREPTPALPDRTALAHALAEAARKIGAEAEVAVYPAPDRSGVEPPGDIWRAAYPEGFVEHAHAQGWFDALLAKTVDDEALAALGNWIANRPARQDVLLAVSGRSITHTRFRRLLSDAGRVRAGTMPGVEPGMFAGVMQADWPLVAARSEAVARLLSAAAEAEVRSGRDCRLRFSLAGRPGIADTGLLTEAGAFGNLPGGEAFIAPVEGTAEGRLAVGPAEDPDRACFHFAGGRLVHSEGDAPFLASLAEALAAHPDAANLAELGVGTNEKARSSEHILEAEKILGTVHLALGDNASFGGTVSVPFHQDYVVYGPTLILRDADGRETRVLENGRFLVETGSR